MLLGDPRVLLRLGQDDAAFVLSCFVTANLLLFLLSTHGWQGKSVWMIRAYDFCRLGDPFA